MKAFLLSLLALFAFVAHAAPREIARSDRSLWPHPLHSAENFDLASRAEILAFARALARSESEPHDARATRLRVARYDRAHVDTVRARYWKRLVAEYRLASAHCTASQDFCAPALDKATLRAQALELRAPSPAYDAWFANANEFHRIYLDELLRLAALFPSVNSEIDLLSGVELDGSELGDRQFLLTFDDGPTLPNGSTDRVIEALRSARVNGTFFAVGTQLQKRLQAPSAPSAAETYTGMCVGSHGWSHRSHAVWSEWKKSVERSVALLKTQTGQAFVPLFRPPYGQRRPESGPFFESAGLRVAFWTIDPLDWNARLSLDDSQGRLLTQMLLWRHGVVLLHDLQDKAPRMVPWILQQTRGAGVRWVDCHRYPKVTVE